MIAVRRGKDASALRLLARVMGAGASLESEYPLVFDSEFEGTVVSLDEAGTSRSACATLPRTFVIGDARIRGGLIGSVATDPAHRSEGLATRLLVEAEATLARAGCAFALLWADDPRFYLERGYAPMGAEDDFVLPRELAARLPEKQGVREGGTPDSAAIHALYQQHPVRVERSAGETCALLACPGMTTLVLERMGTPCAYACVGRGRDLANAVHEWGGAPEDVLALVRAQFERTEAEALYLIAPTSAHTLRARLASLGVEAHRGMLGLGKVVSRVEAAKALGEMLRDRAQVELTTTGPDGRVRIRTSSKTVELDDLGLLAILAGVEAVREDVARFMSELGLADGSLPLEPFVWGLDSI